MGPIAQLHMMRQESSPPPSYGTIRNLTKKHEGTRSQKNVRSARQELEHASSDHGVPAAIPCNLETPSGAGLLGVMQSIFC